jgi:DNA-binding NarL/FixJ family response regulator
VIRVLVADDHAMMRHGLRGVLGAQADIEVVGEAEDGAAAVDEAIRLRPDVVVMDIRMPRLDGIEATKRLVAEDRERFRILVLTTFDLDEYVYNALRAGASAFLLKDAPEQQLLAAIRVVADGGSLFAPSITRRLIERFADHTSTPTVASAITELSPRELDVLRLVARGLSNAEAAAELIVSEHTIKTHVASILHKLDLRNRVQAVVFAYESGPVRPGATRPAE